MYSWDFVWREPFGNRLIIGGCRLGCTVAYSSIRCISWEDKNIVTKFKLKLTKISYNKPYFNLLLFSFYHVRWCSWLTLGFVLGSEKHMSMSGAPKIRIKLTGEKIDYEYVFKTNARDIFKVWPGVVISSNIFLMILRVLRSLLFS